MFLNDVLNICGFIAAVLSIFRGYLASTVEKTFKFSSDAFPLC